MNDSDYTIDSTQALKAIFDIDREVKKPNQPNPLIGSLHRYYNMHVRKGIPQENIQLAFVVHGKSTKHILTDAAYMERYGVKNPNSPLIKELKKVGVKMYVCGQSANYSGISKEEILSGVELALSAMTVLTVFQMNGYAMIRF